MLGNVLVDEQVEVELLTVLGEQFSEEVAVVEVLLEAGHSSTQLHLIVEPVEQQITHRVTQFDN